MVWWAFPYSFICCVFLCLLILVNLLCLGSPFHSLQVCNSHCFWCLPPVANVGSVASCWRGLVPVFWWMRLDLVFLVDRTMSSHVFWCVCDLIMIFGSLFANGCGCVLLLLVVWHGVSNTVACCSLSGAGSSLEIEISGRAFSICYYVELGCLWWTNVLNVALPPQWHRPDTQLEHQDPVSHMAQNKKEEKKKEGKK